MDDRFVVLGSGSSGNCTFVGSTQGGILIDCGFDGQTIASRLAKVGFTWHQVRAVILTHTHTDHWKSLAFDQLKIHKIPLYIHPQHRKILSQLASERYEDLVALNLIQEFQDRTPFSPPLPLVLTPLLVPHDSDPTFAFRIDRYASNGHLTEPCWSIGYASDLGTVTTDLITLFQNVQILAIEFNHDVLMQKQSQRPWLLIQRVLSDQGHLSNVQAAQAVEFILTNSRPQSVKYVVPLHLSRECNHQSRVFDELRKVFARCGSSAEIILTLQDTPTPALPLVSQLENRSCH